MSTDLNGLAKLREPFPPNQISTLPRRNKNGSIIHLSYVGHAALTDRLLDADPLWTWEPLAMNPNGLPVMDELGGMWIKLTVCGVTRLGYGHAGDKTGGDAIKEVIGDALRNAAMRFGAALDLWHKGDLRAHEEEEKPASTSIGASASDLNAASFQNIQPESQDMLRRMVPRIVLAAQHKMPEKIRELFIEAQDNLPDDDPTEVKKALWYLLDSKTRSAISAIEKK